jgi:ribonucleoside-diphosphate reductase alpha chain
MNQLVHQLPLSAVAEAPAIQPLAEQEISAEVLVEKYAKGNETSVHDVRRRVARALAAAEAEDQRARWEARFLEAQQQGFVPAGRISSAAGTISRQRSSTASSSPSAIRSPR